MTCDSNSETAVLHVCMHLKQSFILSSQCPQPFMGGLRASTGSIPVLIHPVVLTPPRDLETSQVGNTLNMPCSSTIHVSGVFCWMNNCYL